MAPDPTQLTFEAIDHELQAFTVDASDRPVKFRQTSSMNIASKRQVPYDDYVVRCIEAKNYRMLFAYMNRYGYDHLSFEMAFKIPVLDVLAIFPQGCFCHVLSLEYPNLTSFDSLITYLWLFGRLGDIVYGLFKAVLYVRIDFRVISKMSDLKDYPFELVKEILKNKVYREVILQEHMNLSDNSTFLGKAPRTDFKGIRDDVVQLVNEFLRLLDPYLSFYEANRRSYRLAFLPWSLPRVDLSYFSQYNDCLRPFRTGQFDFGSLPVWSKTNHLKYPWPFREQVRTFLLMKTKKGSIINRLFHKDLLMTVFQYMAFNALLVEEEEIKYQYRCAINVPYQEDENYSIVVKSPTKRQRFEVDVDVL